MYNATEVSLGPNGYKDSLMNIDLNRIQKNDRGKEMSEKYETLLQQKDQNESSIELDESSDMDLAIDATAHAEEASSSTDVPQMNGVELSAADRAAIEEAQQGTPPGLRQTRTRRQNSSYAPTCSPNGTEISIKAKVKKPKRDTKGSTPSSGSIGNKSKHKTLASSVPDAGSKLNKQKGRNGRKRESNRVETTDFINSSDREDDVSIVEEQRVSNKRNNTVLADNGLDEDEETSQTMNNEPSGSGSLSGAQSKRAEVEDDDVICVDVNEEEEVKEECPAKSSRNKGSEKRKTSKEEKITSSNDSAAPGSDRTSTRTLKMSSKDENKEGQQTLISSGKSLSSILGPSRYKTYRHVGLTRNHGIPSLHLNRHEPRKERKSIPIKFDENKKKKVQMYDGSDDEEEEKFKRREGETEQQFLLRVCDLEGRHDKDKDKRPLNDQENQVIEIEVGTNYDEEEHTYEGEEQEEE